MFCRKCGFQIADDAAFCMSCGTPAATGSQPAFGQQAFPPPQTPPYPGAAPPPYYTPQQSLPAPPSKFPIYIIIGIALFFLLPVTGIIAAIAIPNFLRARNNAHYTACREVLQNVKTGAESYISETGSASGLDPYGDALCNHILPGYDSPGQCAGKVKERVALACTDFQIKPVSDTQYEISAFAKSKSKCGIMITESAALPEKYEDCSPSIPEPAHIEPAATEQ